MQDIAVTRIAHIVPFMEVLQQVGSPVYRELERWSLPTMMAEQPNRYVPGAPVLSCLRSIARREGIDDLGFLAFKRWSLENLDADVLAQLRRWPTLHARLTHFAQLCKIENPDLHVQIRPEGRDARVILDLDAPLFDGLQYSNWLQIDALLKIIRDATGADYQPREMTMRARYTPSDGAHQAFPNTEIITAHEHTSILVPATLLSRTCAPISNAVATASSDACAARVRNVCNSSSAARLKLALPSYLGDGYPTIQTAAVISATSVRSLQRELSRLGTSYSELIQQIRFEEAVRLLSNPTEKIIDIALDLGYEDASHFARAFRRIAGTCPREYRKRHILH